MAMAGHYALTTWRHWVDPSGWINYVVLRCSKLARGSKPARELILVTGLMLHVPWLLGTAQTSWIPSTRAVTGDFWGQGFTLLEVPGSNLDQFNDCPTDFFVPLFHFLHGISGVVCLPVIMQRPLFPYVFPCHYSASILLFETIGYNSKCRRHWVNCNENKYTFIQCCGDRLNTYT
jgi:hypothetical protein